MKIPPEAKGAVIEHLKSEALKQVPLLVGEMSEFLTGGDGVPAIITDLQGRLAEIHAEAQVAGPDEAEFYAELVCNVEGEIKAELERCNVLKSREASATVMRIMSVAARSAVVGSIQILTAGQGGALAALIGGVTGD